jgi:hypothetical protein
VWIDQDRQVAHPAAPHKKGGPGFFASADPLSFDSEPGDLPHPNSPAGRTLDPLRIARFASKVESG